jgi:putative ABC transport system substrate-binding protein
MQRRNFLRISSGLAVWITAAGVSLAEITKLHHVGALLIGNAEVNAFTYEVGRALSEGGYAEGKNFVFDIRSAGENLDRLPALAAELVALKVDVILALYTPCAIAAKGATHEIPIVIVAANPLETGLVSSISRPDSNITGISMMAAELHGKCVEVLHDMFPAASRVAALGNAADPFSKLFLEQVRLAGNVAGVEIAPVVMVRSVDEIDSAFAHMKDSGAGGVVVQGSLASKNSADLALKHRLPTATFTRAFTELGGLLSYGANEPDLFHRSASFVKKILDGGKLAEMPIEQPTKFELVINLKTAKALGITVPRALLARADEVIE